MVKRKHTEDSAIALAEQRDSVVNEFIDGKKIYYKFIDQSLCQHGYQYKYGLNVLPENEKYDPIVKFGDAMTGVGGGFHVYNFGDLSHQLISHSEKKIHEVQIPDDAQIHSFAHRHKVDKLILGHGLSVNEFIKKHNFEEFFLSCDWENLRFIDRQTPEMCERLVKQCYAILRYVKKQTKKLCKLAISMNYEAIKFVRKQTPDLCDFAIDKNAMALLFIKRKTKKMYRDAFKVDPSILYNLWTNKCNVNVEIYKLAVESNYQTLKWMKPENITEELYLIGLQQEPKMIEKFAKSDYYWHDSYKKLSKIAVQRDGMELQYVPHNIMTQKMCDLAVEQNPMASQFVPDRFKMDSDEDRKSYGILYGLYSTLSEFLHLLHLSKLT